MLHYNITYIYLSRITYISFNLKLIFPKDLRYNFLNQYYSCHAFMVYCLIVGWYFKMFSYNLPMFLGWLSKDFNQLGRTSYVFKYSEIFGHLLNIKYPLGLMSIMSRTSCVVWPGNITLTIYLSGRPTVYRSNIHIIR